MTAAVHLAIDWAATRERVTAAQRSIDAAFVDDLATHSALLADRARRLAVRGATRQRGDRSTQIVAFVASGTTYALDIAALTAVGRVDGAAGIPGAGRACLGLFVAGGTIWSLIDLAALLGGESAAESPGGFALYLRGGSHRIALRADRLAGLRRLDPRRLVVPPGGGRHPDELATGVSEDGLIVLDPGKILAHSAFAKVI